LQKAQTLCAIITDMKPEVNLPFSASSPDAMETSRPEQINNGAVEQLSGASAEVSTKAAENSGQVADAILTTSLPAPVDDNAAVVDDTSSAIDAPAVAADDDLIEKVWVDKAKKIVSETKDDPYNQDQAISELQLDYLKKRYGRVIGASSKK
jgi:hypothetical protein